MKFWLKNLLAAAPASHWQRGGLTLAMAIATSLAMLPGDAGAYWPPGHGRNWRYGPGWDYGYYTGGWYGYGYGHGYGGYHGYDPHCVGPHGHGPEPVIIESYPEHVGRVQRAAPPAIAQNTAHVYVTAPQGARVSINGKTVETIDASKPIIVAIPDGGAERTIEVRAEKAEGGTILAKTRLLTVERGDSLTVVLDALHPEGISSTPVSSPIR